MQIFGETISLNTGVFLLIALAMALSFEFVNGFHDTANAVATVIYTRSLRPVIAVVWSGCWNLIGVLTSAGGVAFGVLALLPVELVLNVGSGAGFAMVFALLISAIIWNVGTWYLGLPASSSHTLIGSIMGVGLANSVAMALGLGTMIGWKRIVVTVGEKIGKSHLTYAQGASAELVAMGTILAADHFGLPVSTTHVLSSGIAGTMAANRSGLQAKTLRNILLAWILTLPVCVLLGAATFSAALYAVLNVFHMRA
jgi:phosphate/sulfate permease